MSIFDILLSNNFTSDCYATVTFLSPTCSQILQEYLEPLALLISSFNVVST